METPAAQEITDRRGDRLPDPPSSADIEHQADRLRLIKDDELPQGALSRLSPDELEQRRLAAITK